MADESDLEAPAKKVPQETNNHYGTDPHGNVMPTGLYYRNGVYYAKAMRHGVRHHRSTGKRDFKSALRAYHEIMKSWNDGDFDTDSPAPTLEAYWLESYRPAWTVGKKTPLVGRGPKYQYSDDQLIVAPLKALGKYRLDAITPTKAQAWANSRRAATYKRKVDGPSYPISEGTVTRELGLIQAIFQKAVDDQILTHNPWKRVEREPFATKERVLSESEQARLEATLSPRYQRWLLFMLGTGLRLGECQGIREAEDLDFSARSVRVTRKTRGRKKKVQDVPLIDSVLLDVLQEQLAEDGQLWHQNQGRFREILTQACEKTGVAHVSPHTLRHTFATRYLRGGGDIYVLSKILGHSSVSITEKVYAHLLTDDLLKRSMGVNLGLVQPRVLPFKREA